MRSMLFVYVIAVCFLPAGLVVADTETEFDFSKLQAVNTDEKTVLLGGLYSACQRTDDAGKFKFQAELTSRGAAVAGVTLSEFDDRTVKKPVPLQLLSPVGETKPKYTLANGIFELSEYGKSIPLDRLNWQCGDVVYDSQDNSQSVSFVAVIKDANLTDSVKITKTYRLKPASYDLECELIIENLCDKDIQASLNIQGPVGINREGLRGDMRRIAAAFIVPEGKIESIKVDGRKLQKAANSHNEETAALFFFDN